MTVAGRYAWVPLVAILCLPSHAQPPTPAAAGGGRTSIGTATGEAPDLPYEDRVIKGLTLTDDDADTAFRYDTSGLPRYLRFETRLGTLPFDPTRTVQSSMALYSLIETPNHGTFSLDANHAPREGLGSVTLRQRGIPLDGGRLAHLEAGVISAPSPDVLRTPSRIYLPLVTLQGVSAEVESLVHFGQLQASTGTPGRLAGQPLNAYVREPGRVSTVGGQWQLRPGQDPSRPGWMVAVLHENARGVTGTSGLGRPIDADSTLLGFSHEVARYHIHARLMSTRSSDVEGRRLGYWFEGELMEGPRTHGYGLYRFERDLSWAGQAIANDLSGAYYRHNWRTRQLVTDFSVDWLRRLSGDRADGVYATGSARWRLNRDHTLGAGLTFRRFRENAWNSYTDWRWLNGWGTSSLRLELGDGSASDAQRTQQLTYDQDWNVPLGWSLSTSLSAGRYGAVPLRNERAEDYVTAALSTVAPLDSRTTLRGTWLTERGSDGERRQNINLSANWRISQGWSLEGHYNRNTGRSRSPSSLDPLAPPLPEVATLSDHSFYALLRYELQGGSRNAPLGGKPQEGGGRIEGVVFFDHNRNGHQEASETGVAGVTLFLDNRYAVRTDDLGRFSFPFVATGPRTVNLRSETLPLPWATVDDGQVKVDVRLRETTRLLMPVQREP